MLRWKRSKTDHRWLAKCDGRVASIKRCEKGKYLLSMVGYSGETIAMNIEFGSLVAAQQAAEQGLS